MKRTDLLITLRKAAPALAVKDVIPVFTNFLFDGKTVLAHDDVVTIALPCKLDIEGGLPGQLILDWLAASRAKDVAIEASDDSVSLKAGRSKLNAPLTEPEDFVFSFPNAKKAQEIKLTSGFMKAMTRAAISMGEDPAHPWRMGVTLSQKKGKLTFYSSDNMSVGRSVVRRKGDDFELVLAPPFVNLLITIAKRDEPKVLLLGRDWVEARFDSKLRLWAKTLAEVEVSRYRDIFKSVLSNDFEVANIPKGFSACLDRMLVVLARATDKYAKAVVTDGKLRLTAESPVGVVKDILKVDLADVDERFLPEAVKRAMLHVEEMAIIPGVCCYLRGENYEHCVSLISEE